MIALEIEHDDSLPFLDALVHGKTRAHYNHPYTTKASGRIKSCSFKTNTQAVTRHATAGHILKEYGPTAAPRCKESRTENIRFNFFRLTEKYDASSDETPTANCTMKSSPNEPKYKPSYCTLNKSLNWEQGYSNTNGFELSKTKEPTADKKGLNDPPQVDCKECEKRKGSRSKKETKDTDPRAKSGKIRHYPLSLVSIYRDREGHRFILENVRASTQDNTGYLKEFLEDWDSSGIPIRTHL